MESIQQFELILMSKMGASSPTAAIIEDIPYDEDNFANDHFLKLDEFTGIDFLAELDKDEKMYLEELQQITEKIDLPLYDLMNGNDGSGNDDQFNATAKTDQLLMDFESICDAEFDHLTPPQTPPEQKFFGSAIEDHQYVQNIPNIEQQQQQEQFIYESPVHEQYIYEPNSDEGITAILESSNESMTSCDIDPEPIILSPTNSQLEQEIVDEIIQAHSRSQSDYDDATSSSWSPRSSDYSPSICSLDDDIPIKKSAYRRPSTGGVTKKRTRPYGRNPEEKKSRKKEQNKNAATRYRQKKKDEVHEILGEERGLMDRNKKLMTAFKDTKREVKYLKSLLKELFQARGFIQ